jgi:hypothetical protein
VTGKKAQDQIYRALFCNTWQKNDSSIPEKDGLSVKILKENNELAVGKASLNCNSESMILKRNSLIYLIWSRAALKQKSKRSLSLCKKKSFCKINSKC